MYLQSESDKSKTKPSNNYNQPFNRHKLSVVLMVAALGLYSLPGYAYFCSGNGFNGYINLGDTPTQVSAACGQPTSQTTQQPPTSDVSQYWSYTNQAIVTDKNMSSGHSTTQVQQTGPMITLKITGNKVTNITVDGSSVASTSACQTGQTIHVNSTTSDVLLSCGNPSSMSTVSNAQATPPPPITVWTYDYGAYRNPMVLQFSADGHLQQVSQ